IDVEFLDHSNIENMFGLGFFAGKNRRKLKGFLGEGFLWLVGGSPGDERLAGSYSVDSADLLNGILHELILAEAVERGDNIELSRNEVSLDEVREGLQLLEDAPELALDFD